MENLMTRLRRMGGLFLIGLLVIIFAALGILYAQQGTKQEELREQIAKLSVTIAKPMPSAEKLQKEYEEVNRSLSPLTMKAALDIIISVAEESGIDVDPDSNKFRIPPQESVREEKVGDGNYQVLSFNNILAQGDYESVMTFVSNLESGETLKTLVLKRVTINQVELKAEGEEEAKTEAIATLNVDIYTKAGGESL